MLDSLCVHTDHHMYQDCNQYHWSKSNTLGGFLISQSVLIVKPVMSK